MATRSRGASDVSDDRASPPPKRLQTSTWLMSSFTKMITLTFDAMDAAGKYEQFMIHKDLLFRHSEFFRETPNAAITINSKGISPNQFKVYVDWLYTQRTNITALLRGTYFIEGDPLEFDLLRERYIGKTLCELWVMGGILGDCKFKNEIIDSLLSFDFFVEEKAAPDVVRFIIQKAGSESRLYLWLAHHLCGMREFEYNSIKKELDAEMLRLVLDQYVSNDRRAASSGSVDGALDSVNKCRFHEHAPGDLECDPVDVG